MFITTIVVKTLITHFATETFHCKVMTSILENWEFFPKILQEKWYFELAQLKSKTSGLGLGWYLGEDYSQKKLFPRLLPKNNSCTFSEPKKAC